MELAKYVDAQTITPASILFLEPATGWTNGITYALNVIGKFKMRNSRDALILYPTQLQKNRK